MKYLKTFEKFKINESHTINKENLKDYYIYSWYEERGELSVDVTNAETDEVVYSFNSNSLEDEDRQNYFDSGFDLVTDGFMKNMDDVDGLAKHLKSLDIIPRHATVLTQEEFDNANVSDDNDYINEAHSERFLKTFVKDGDETITVTNSSEINEDIIKSGKKIIFENYLFIPNLEKLTCMCVKDAPKSMIGYKYVYNYRYRTLEQLIESITRFIDSHVKYKEEKDKYKEEKKIKHKEGLSKINDVVKVGDILYDSWGYDQTNIDFYQVTKVLDASVMIRPIKGEMVEGSGGFMSSNVKPIKDAFIGEEIRKTIRFHGDEFYLPSKFGAISKYTSGDKGVYSSWYA